MRFKVISENEMTDAQRGVYEEICSGPRGRRGPPGTKGTDLLTRCPDLARHAQKIGEYIRFRSTLPHHIAELAILITARHWSAQYEWHAHYPIALKAGLSAALIAELAQGRRPAAMKDDEAAAYQFCTELQRDKKVSDATFNAAIKQFGETGVVDLMGALAYYALISMALNVNQTPIPDGSPPPLPPLANQQIFAAR
jgi:4-carboxymuconolactone decarboxylase